MEPQTLAFPFPVSFQTLLYQSKAVRTSQTRRRSPPGGGGKRQSFQKAGGRREYFIQNLRFLWLKPGRIFGTIRVYTRRKAEERSGDMKLLEERIRKDGKIKSGDVLKVDSFLNHQIDVELLEELGKEFYRLFGQEGITKILTIEASGIGVACITARYFGCPVIFAKKNKTKNIAGDVYTSKVESFTHGRVYDIIVSREFLLPGDRVLLIDDFLANGSALMGLIELVRSAGATLVGAGICVEKAFQPGGKMIRDMGVRVESLARVASMSEDGSIEFC